jgi:hypothetical protein
MKLDPDIEIKHLSGPQWGHLLTLFGSIPQKKVKSVSRPLLLRVTFAGQVVKLWHSNRGRLNPEETSGTESVKELSARFNDARVISLTTDALTQLAARWQKSVDFHTDFFDQIFGLIGLLPSSSGLDIHPAPKWFGLPSFLRSSIFGVFVPRNRCVVVLITKDEQVWTSIIIRHGENGLDLLTTSEFIFDATPKSIGPAWVVPLSEAVEKKYGAVHGSIGLDWCAFWNGRRNPTREYFSQLEEEGRLVRKHFPLSWKLVLWTVDTKHRRKLKRLSKEEQQLRTAPLLENDLETFL